MDDNYHKVYYINNADKLKSKSRARHRINKAKGKRSWIERTYGINQAQFEALLEAQGFRCALCLRTATPKRNLAIDHDHATGKVRGILCVGCNTKLAIVEDKRFISLANLYLQKNPYEIFLDIEV